jgi:hypothetical protein
MNTTIDLTDAKEKAAAIDKVLTAYDFDDTCVLVEHKDGSRLLFAWAFYRDEGDYYYVFTEHQGYHVFCKDEVEISIKKSKR